MSSEGPHDHGPHVSTDPAYTETWYWNLVDPDSRCVATLHCSWMPAVGRGQHTMGVLTPQGTRRERVDTVDPFSSEIATVTILDPWARARIRSTVLDVDIEWEAFHPAIDFGAALQLGPDIALVHFEGGGRGSGWIGGRSVRGSGFRDRSFGPRNMRKVGRHWALCVEGVDRDVFLAYNSVTTSDLTFDDPANRYVGCLWLDGSAQLYDQSATLYRHRDASPVLAAFPGGIEVNLDLRRSFGDQRHIFDPNSGPSSDKTTEAVYGTRDWYIVADSPQLGPLVGFYEEGVLWAS